MAHLPKGQGIFLPPFKAWLASNIPAVYDNTMSYYEELVALIKYLQDIVVPAVNDNAAAVTAISEAQEKLQAYVDNYFDNLDVQEEINNKLDQMAEDGTLQEIITSYIQANVAWTFDTLSEALASTNLVNGSYVHLLGYNSLNDGGEGYYKVREIEESETEDGVFTHAYGDSLMLELIDNGTISTHQCGIFADLTDLSDKLKLFFAHDTANYIVNSGTYIVSDNITLTSNSHIIFDEGAYIKFTGNSEDYFLFYILNKQNILIENANLIGNRTSHAGVTYTSGFLYTVMYSQNITLKNCTAKDAWCDGFYVGNSFTQTPTLETKNIKLINCSAITSGRNGFSVCSGENIQVINCESDGAVNNPGSGIDIETEGNTSDYATYIKLINIHVENFKSANGKYGISTYNNNHTFSNVIVLNHSSYNDERGESVNLKQKGDIKFIGSNIRNSSINAIIIYESSGSSNVYIKDMLVDGCSSQSVGDTTRAIELFGSTNDYDSLKNITIDNVDYTNTDNIEDYPYFINEQHYKINNVVIKNVNLDSSKPPIAFYHAGDVKLINCVIEKTITSTPTISRYGIANHIFDSRALTANKVDNFYYPMPDGDYHFALLNNGSGYTNAIVFANDYEVRKAGTVANNTYVLGNVSDVLYFNVHGNKVTII